MRGAAPSPAPPFSPPRLWRIAGLLIAFALGAWCFAPALHAWFAQDDYAFLALVRLLHQPWLVFVHDHFPGSMYFRPLGLFLWWLAAAVGEDAARPQYALNLILHLACVAALYTLLQRLRRDALLNALWAALYAVHPLAVGTALWLADRFDLLTTLFSLLALHTAFAYTERPRAASLLGMLGALLLGLLSKELAVVASAAVFAAIALASRAALDIKHRIAALAAVAILTAGWLAYRRAMLTSFGDASAHLPALASFASGFWNWLRAGAVFLFEDPRASRWSVVLVALASAMWAAAAVMTHRRGQASTPRPHAAAALLVLILLPGLVQAPVAYKHLAGTIGSDMFFFHLIVPSRFFHLSLAGLVCGLALITTPARAGGTAVPLRLSAAGLVIALVALAPLSHRIAHEYASGTRKDIAAFGALEAALDRAAIPEHACQIYVLGTSSLWGFAGYSDPIAKGLAARPERLDHCLIGTERPPYAYFLRTDSVQPADYRPLHPLEVGGKPFPILQIGDAEARYFTMDEDIATSIPDGAIFLEYRDGAFVDVSAAVRSGERKVDFAPTGKN